MDELIKQLPYWDKLGDSEKNDVKSSARLMRCEKGMILHGNCDGGGSCMGMVYVVSGEIRTYLISDEGREITLFRLNAGDNCVLSASCIMSYISFETQMTVTEDAELLVIPTSVFKKLTSENLNVRCFMYELATERFASAMWVMQQMIFARFDGRLATFLVEQYRKTGSPEVHMTQAKIAEEVNSAREVVARMLKQFAADGLIENRRGVIVLKDIEGLELLSK